MRTSLLLVSALILGGLTSVAHATVTPVGVIVFGQAHDSTGLINNECGSTTTVVASPGSCTASAVAMQSVSASADIRTGDLVVSGTQGPTGGLMLSVADIRDVLTFSGASSGQMGTAQLTASGTFSGIDVGHVTIQYTVLSVGTPVMVDISTQTFGSSLDLSQMFPLDEGPIQFDFFIQMTGLSTYTFNDPITITLPTGVTYTSQSGEFLTGATAVPEPASAILVLTGLAGLGFARRLGRRIPSRRGA